MALSAFHPCVGEWFRSRFAEATQVQTRAWPAIRGGGHALIAAPTGSGKTLAAFLAAIDVLVRRGLEGSLRDQTTVLYVSPLRALSNDVQRNLQLPLEGIREALVQRGLEAPEIRAWVRTGDTPASERERMRRHPPQIVVTTPESLYILLSSDSGRRMLATVETVIVDEIHAVAGTKRGSHLALSLERLAALTPAPPQRIGLSATQKPMSAVAELLTGGAPCSLIDTGHRRDRDMALEVPATPLGAVMSNETWEEVYDRLAELARAHRTTLVFVNTRRLCERAARHLAERLGDDAVTSHHGSLAREHRLEAERRLKAGELGVLVATASLELGIDIGDVDLVCQMGSPRSIGAVLQRVGRSGHGVGRTPKGRLFPLTRDELVECTALLGALADGGLDRLRIPAGPLDVLAQQVVAEVAAEGEITEDALYQRFTRAAPYRALSRQSFDEVLAMLAAGFGTRRGRRSAYLHRDAVNGRLRPRRSARLAAVTSGGAIPDQFDYDVVLQPEGLRVGSVNEDFAFESLPGDVFQLGNRSYRILKVESGRVFTEDARGAPPTIPFWFGEAPGRSDELSAAVSELRAEVEARLAEGGVDAARRWLVDRHSLPEAAAGQLSDYLAMAREALGALPTQSRLVLERFFDEAGDMHLVLHSPFGSRLNRAWGLALRKRFCRKFNFELQAAALEDSIVLSLGPSHSFALEEVAGYLHSATAREVLTQALLDAPMFTTRWRWCATIALAVQRTRNGRRRPAQLQRQDAEDLMAVVFPDQLACAENLAGAREIPDHPLVTQTLADCLTDTMDVAGLEAVLAGLEAGRIEVQARDLAAPSPLAEEVINARPYAFLDDGAAEERRTLSIAARPGLELADAAALARPSPQALERVRREAWPEPRDADEFHDALVVAGFLTAAEGAELDTGSWFPALCAQRRATALQLPGGSCLWVAAERLAEPATLHTAASRQPVIEALGAPPEDADTALTELLRSRLEVLGPVTAAELGAPLEADSGPVGAALARLEAEGFVLRGRFAGPDVEQWCERRLLARIQRYTVARLRSEIEPVSPADYLRFLLDWHGLTEPPEGTEALAAALEQLEGFCIPAGAWETEVLPARVADYAPAVLDPLLAGGRFAWLRLTPPRPAAEDDRRRPAAVRQTPVALLERPGLVHWRRLNPGPAAGDCPLGSAARRVLEALERGGAAFFADLVAATGLLRTQVEEGLGELVAWGLVASDTFNGLRALTTPAHKRPSFAPRHRPRRRTGVSVELAGRWARLAPPPAPDPAPGRGRRPLADPEAVEHVAWALLRRYGVVFRRVLERESAIPPWRELLYVLHRLEARGEIRGGRFVSQFAGEQFAHPDALGALKAARRRGPDGTRVAVAAVDPLNLVGIVTPGPRLPALSGSRLLYHNGKPEAVLAAGDIRFLDALGPEQQWQARESLLRRQGAAQGGLSREMHAK